MAIATGKDAKVMFGVVLIADVVDYTFNIESPILSEGTLGQEWVQVAGIGIKGAKGTLSRLIDTAETSGHNALEAACLAGTKIVDFQLYVNDTDYWCSDTVSIADAGVFFSNYSATAGANDIVKFSCDFEFHSNVHRTS